ncbi:NYN domain-containing protein [Aliigemmobacter aestuarii]|uniref:NYN domain-containing protein n=1 Tax=Aliigemmobacter aestuarii TaxID=1445661 RepID=A0A4S3MNP4_9RHOB|nr:NYN domain-containing protein [Gemmobacter aestuarii]THD83543.1 NYN domain-containing protein [Gemmobacter aestuarii]
MARDGAKLLAVLIDADNVSANAAEAILQEIAGFGEPGLRRVYGDWSSGALAKWKDVSQKLGLVMHQQSANTKGKNASDIGLVIDAMDILHGGKFDGFVLVSSDSDFTRLASRIREDGLEVIGIGEEKTPPSLRNVCNRFVFIENILRDVEKPEPATGPKTTRRAEPAEAPRDGAEKEPPSRVVPLARKAMNMIDPDGEWYSLGQVGQFIQRENPDFDPRTYGSAKLSDLLKRAGAFEVRQGTGNHLEVRRRD